MALNGSHGGGWIGLTAKEQPQLAIGDLLVTDEMAHQREVLVVTTCS